jgi:septal ring factor EnvC (AmiA/AmiB activator)
MGGIFPGGGGGGEAAARAQIHEMRKETARQKAKADAERAEIAKQDEARRRARQRGGSRMLLSEARIAPETGIGETLGKVS